MEAWLESIRLGLGKHASTLQSYGLSEVGDLALVDVDIISEMREELEGAGVSKFVAALFVKAAKEAAGISPPPSSTSSAPPTSPIPFGVPQLSSQRFTPVQGMPW